MVVVKRKAARLARLDKSTHGVDQIERERTTDQRVRRNCRTHIPNRYARDLKVLSWMRGRRCWL